VIHKSIKIEKGEPTYAAVNPNTNTAYISYEKSNFIIVIDLEKGTIENKIQLNCPGNISINRVTNKVYVSSANGICEINCVNKQHDMINIGLPHSDGSVDVNPQTNLLYTTCFGHDVLSVIDAPTQSIVDKIPVGKNPKGVAIDTGANKVYVTNYDSSSVSIIDSHQSNKIVDTIKFEKKDGTINPSFALVNEFSKILYVKTDSTENWVVAAAGAGGVWYGSELYVVDIDTKEDINSKTLPFNSEVGFAFNQRTNQIYMMKRGERSILKFDAFLKEHMGITTVDKPSLWRRLFGIDIIFFAEVIAVNPSTNKVYVSDSENNLLYEIDG